MEAALCFCQIICLPSETKALLSVFKKEFSLGKTKNQLQLNIPGNNDSFFSTKITEGLYKGCLMFSLAYYDTEEKKILNLLKMKQYGLYFVGETPGWASEPIYLLWHRSRFSSLLNHLQEQKNLVKTLKIRDNKGRGNYG